MRIGPAVVHRRWKADTIKAAVADEAVTRLSEVTPDETTLVGTRVINQLIHGGWHTDESGHGFAAGQPMFNFQLPLRHADGTQKTDDELLKGMNQLWRRNIKKADKEGVVVRQGTRDDLAHFHRIYLETARARPASPDGPSPTSRPCGTRSTPRTTTGFASTSPSTTATSSRRPPTSASASTPGLLRRLDHRQA